MMTAHGLPNFDAWLTHNPYEDDASEPRDSDYAQARAQLGLDADDDAVEELAQRLYSDWLADAQASEDDHNINNYEDDRNGY